MTKKRLYKIPRAALVAAVIILILSLATMAMAYVGFTRYENPGAMLNAFFGENGRSKGEGYVEQGQIGDHVYDINWPGWERVPVDERLAEELINGYISGETGSDSWNGYTLTVEANLYDPVTKSGFVYYTLENSKGISGYEVFPDGELWFNPDTISVFPRANWADTGAAGRAFIDDGMSTEQKLYICEYYIAHGTKKTAELKVELWSYEHASVKASVKLHLPEDSGMPTLDPADGKALVSPISVRVNRQALGLDESIRHVSVKYNDGTEYVLYDYYDNITNWTYSLYDGDYITYVFNRIVDINSLSEIVLDDMIITVK